MAVGVIVLIREVVRRCWPQRPMGDLNLSILGHYS